MDVKDWLGEDNTLGVDIWHRKYQYENETFDQWLDRISNGNTKLAQLILDKKFLFGGRILANRGLHDKGRKISMSNCYVMAPPEDNIESIFECAKELARTYSYGGGCGVDISKLAPRGAKIHNAAKETSGAVSFMDLYSETTGIIGQNGRRGALMITLDCHHPDLEEFIDIKTDLNRVTKANISIRITDDFMQAVLDDTNFELSFTREDTGETISKVVNARKIFKRIAENNWNYAEPGVLFWDKITSWNLLSEDESFQLAGTNPCITSDTLIFTGDGRYLVPIGKLYEEYIKDTENFNVPVLTWDDSLQRTKFEKINWVQSTGVKPVYEVHLDDGSYIKATKDHLFMLSNGRKVPLCELNIGDCLMPFHARCYEEYSGYRNMLVNLNNGKTKNYYHLQSEYYFGTNLEDFGRSKSSLNVHHKDKNHMNNLPDNLEVITQSCHASEHISGSNNPMVKWFNETTEENRQAYRAKMRERNSGVNNPNYGKKASKETLDKLSKATSRFMKDPVVKEHHKQGMLRSNASHVKSILLKIIDSGMEINEENYMKCKKEISKVYPTYSKAYEIGKQFGYDNLDDFFHYLLTDFNHRIVSIEYVGDEPVYDMNVANNHNFAVATSIEYNEGVDHFEGNLSDIQSLDGIIIGNCGEEPLPAGGSCLLGALNLSEFVKYPFTDCAEFSFGEFRQAIYIAVDALNEVLDEGLPLHPLQQQRDTVRDWRQIGLGIMGLADMLIKMGITYGSDEAIELCDNIGYVLANSAIYESYILSIKSEPYPKYNRVSIKDSEYFKHNIQGTESYIDGLLDTGLRNSQLLTIAPTGTISTMLGVSGGIEPIFATSYDRKTESLFGEEKHYKVYTPIVKYYMKQYGLSDEKNLPSYFVTSHNISYHSRIDMQAIWQQHIDASISSTINVPSEFTVENVVDLYIYAWKCGLKGCTIYRDNCKRSGVLSTKDTKKKKDVDSLSKTELATEHKLRRGEIIHVHDNIIGKKRRLVTGCGTLHCIALFDPNSGDLVEVYLSKGSEGGCNNFMISLSRMISISARGGISIYDIVDQLDSTGACPSYAVRRATHKDTSKGSCCPMAVGKALLDMYKEVQRDLYNEKDHSDANIDARIFEEDKDTSNLCPECGEPLVFEGGCNTCKNCGWSRCS